MILKTKILLSTVIFVAVTIIIQELIFNMYYTDTYETPRQYLKLFIVGVIEFFQLVNIFNILKNKINYTNYKKILLIINKIIFLYYYY